MQSKTCFVTEEFCVTKNAQVKQIEQVIPLKKKREAEEH